MTEANLVQALRARFSRSQDVWEQRGCIWALGAIGSTEAGIYFVQKQFDVVQMLTELSTSVGSLQGVAYTVLSWICRSNLGSKLVKDKGFWSVGKIQVDEWVLDKMFPFEEKKISNASDVFYSETDFDNEYTCEPWLNHHHRAEEPKQVWSTRSSGIEVMSSLKKNSSLPMVASTCSSPMGQLSTGISSGAYSKQSTYSISQSQYNRQNSNQNNNQTTKLEPRMAHMSSFADSLKVHLTFPPVEEHNLDKQRRNLPCLPLDVTKMFGDDSNSNFYRPRTLSIKSVDVSLAGSDLVQKGLSRVQIPENFLFSKQTPKIATPKNLDLISPKSIGTPKFLPSKKRKDIKQKMEKYWNYFADSRKRFDLSDFQGSQSLEVELLELTDSVNSDGIFKDVNTYFYVMDLIENQFRIQLYDSEVRNVINHVKNDKNQEMLKSFSDTASVFQRQIQGRRGLLSLFNDITY